MEKITLLTFFGVLSSKIKCWLSPKNTISRLGLQIPDLFFFSPQSQNVTLEKRLSYNSVSKSWTEGMFLNLRNFTTFISICFLFFFIPNTAQVFPGTAPVNIPAGSFQIEGDLQANTPLPAGKGDWLPLSGSTGTGGNVLSAAGAPVNALTTFHLTDLYNTSENNFSGGKKFNDNPNIWTWVNNNALAKCDINNALFHFTTAPYTDPITHLNSVHTWLIVAADRRSNSGNAYIDFELLQNTMTDNTNGTFSSAGPNNGRTKGDILLTLAITNGGGAAEFFVNKWDNPAGIYDYIDKTSSTPAGSVYASTNAGNVPVSFSAFGSNQYSSNLFVEAAIDLTALLGAIDPCTSLGVKTLFIKTKTSQSPTATIVDFINAKQVSLRIGLANASEDQSQCGNAFSVTGTATPSPGDGISSTSWSVVSGSASIASPSSATSNISVTSSPATLRYTVATTNGCSVYDDVVLTVKPAPGVPTVSVVNNCDGSSDLTASNYTGSLLWSNGATTASIHVTNAATYTVTQTATNGCASLSGSGTSAPKTTPGTPTVSVVNNCDGSSDLTASDYTGSLLWSNGATTASIHVTNAATYAVTQTVNGCVSTSGSGTSAPKTTPGTPTVSLVNNCDGSSDLRASNYTGSLLWSNGATTVSIHVTNAATYTVTQTATNGCTSLSGSGTSAPKTTPGTPTVSVVNNCDGSSDLTASNYTGSLLWSNGATTASIHVTNAATYTVTQTATNGCTSLSGSGTSAPKTTPGTPTVNVVNNCDGSSDLTASNYTGSLLWSNGATTASIHVTNAATYTVAQTATNGCTSLSGFGTSSPKMTPSTPLFIITQPSLCGASAGSIEICNPVPGYTYNLVGGSSFVAESGKPVIFIDLAAGSNPSITVTNTVGCTSAAANCSNGVINCSTSASTIAAKTTGTTAPIEVKNTTVGFDAYPVPFKDQLTIKYKFDYKSDVKIEVFNAQGMSVLSKTDTDSYLDKEVTLDLKASKRQEQVYIVKMTTDQGTFTKKVMSKK
ncbi:T9SS type A sorting domain-containing protein [Flavobacterium sp. ZS1P70]|uniref:T9SS type A sorting domain-containing protein n=1 Tax=Flavobacterium zhoui TaxID=3230414 RepID=A0ABW6I5J2_9FLAO